MSRLSGIMLLYYSYFIYFRKSPFYFSVSQDQTVMLWKLDLDSKAVDCIHIGRGHERSIECVDVDSNSSFIATGGWDNMIKIWAASTTAKQKYPNFVPLLFHMWVCFEQHWMILG